MNFRAVVLVAAAVCLPSAVFAQTAPAVRPGKDASASRKEIKVVARNTAAEARAPLTPAELAVALRVDTGTLPCELGQSVVLTPDAAAPGFFRLGFGKETFRVSPEETTTGAIRLEDKAAGVVWLQLANKSMLMSQKQGRRLADECVSPAQAVTAQAMLKNPPPSVLDAPAAVVAAPATAVVAPATAVAAPATAVAAPATAVVAPANAVVAPATAVAAPAAAVAADPLVD